MKIKLHMRLIDDLPVQSTSISIDICSFLNFTGSSGHVNIITILATIASILSLVVIASVFAAVILL